jgi:hypothetical protein
MLPKAAIAARGINPLLLGGAALGAGAIAVGANQLMGGGNDYADIADPAEAAMARQVDQSIMVGERAGQFKADLEQQAVQQAYNNQRGLAGQQINAAANQQDAQLRAEQANQILNAHLAAQQNATNAAQGIAGQRFY